MTQKSKAKQQKNEEDKIEKNPNSTFFSDTTFKTCKRNSLEWSQIYTFIKEEISLKNMNQMQMIWLMSKDLKLHKIATRPWYAIFPYYDMVRWIISHIDISTCTIVNSSHQIVGSFSLRMLVICIS
jgi:hypothetical protein